MNEKYKAYRNGILIFLSYTIYFIFAYAFSFENAYKWFSIFIYFQIIYVFLSWKRITLSFFDSYILFSIAIYIFSLGHAFLDLFNGVSTRYSLIESWGIKKEDYFSAEYITAVFLLFMHFGAIRSFSNRIINKHYNNNLNIDAQLIWKVGFGIGIVSLPFYAYSTLNELYVSFVSGYMGLYDSDNLVYGSASYYNILADFFPPACICLIISAEVLKKRRALIYFLVFLFTCLPPLFIGSRTNAVIMCGIMALIYSFFNKIKVKHILIGTISVYIAVFSLILVRNIRLESDVNDLLTVIENTKEKDDNIIFSIISEMGWSMFPIVKTIEIKQTPGEKYLYGTSFLWSTTTVIPNLFWDIHPAKEHADMSDWLTKKLNLSFGSGYALVAEAYANFGIFGFIFMYFFGLFIVKLFKYSTSQNAKKHLIECVVSLIFLWFITRVVRNNFLDTVRFIVYYILPIYLILKYFSHKSYFKNVIKNTVTI